jgi:hypothetical protein
MDIHAIMTSPLTQSGNSAQFLRLVLAEAASFGMPGHIIATLDDIAAMLGFYLPLPQGQAGHLGGPLVAWRTHPNQPLFESIHEVEALAYKQRALIAFGAGKPGQMVGTAEIVCACGNIAEGTSPPDYYEVFQWASLDVLSTLSGDTVEEILRDPNKSHWKLIPDDDVLQPAGRLYPTYQIMATSIRREAIAAFNQDPRHPRELLRPLAAVFVESHAKVLAEAEAEGLEPVAKALREALRTIQGMFPDLKTMAEEREAIALTREHA